MKSKAMTIILYVLGAYHFATGIVAYFMTGFFYERFTAHTGPFNDHFLSDVGAAYLTAGLALMLAAYIEKWRVPFAVSAVLFLGLHSLIHIAEIVTGQLDGMQIASDLITVILPTAFVGAMVYYAAKSANR